MVTSCLIAVETLGDNFDDSQIDGSVKLVNERQCDVDIEYWINVYSQLIAAK